MNMLYEPGICWAPCVPRDLRCKHGVEIGSALNRSSIGLSFSRNEGQQEPVVYEKVIARAMIVIHEGHEMHARGAVSLKRLPWHGFVYVRPRMGSKAMRSFAILHWGKAQCFNMTRSAAMIGLPSVKSI